MLIFVLLQKASQPAEGFPEKNSIFKPSWTTFLSIVFAGLFFMTPRMYEMFADVVFQEQTLIPLLAAFTFFYISFRRSEKIFDGIVALIICNWACYVKEPAFLIFAVFAVVGLIQGKSAASKQRVFHLLLLLSSMIFVILYLVLVLRLRCTSGASPSFSGALPS